MRARDGVTSNSVTGGAQFAVSANGTLVYRPGYAAGADILLHWMDREGKTTPLQIDAGELFNPAFSSGWPARDGDPRGTTEHLGATSGTGDKLRRLTSDPVACRETGLDTRWQPDRVCIGARGQIDAEPVVAARRRDWRCAPPHGEQAFADAWLMAPERQVSGVRGDRTRRRAPTS